MSTIPNLLYPSVNHENKPTPVEIFNLDDFWKHGEQRAYRFTPKDDGAYHCLIVVGNEFYGFEFTPNAGSLLEFDCQHCADGGSVTLTVYRRRFNGVLVPRVRGVAK